MFCYGIEGVRAAHFLDESPNREAPAEVGLTRISKSIGQYRSQVDLPQGTYPVHTCVPTLYILLGTYIHNLTSSLIHVVCLLLVRLSNDTTIPRGLQTWMACVEDPVY